MALDVATILATSWIVAALPGIMYGVALQKDMVTPRTISSTRFVPRSGATSMYHQGHVHCLEPHLPTSSFNNCSAGDSHLVARRSRGWAVAILLLASGNDAAIDSAGYVLYAFVFGRG